jgi:hypothetical protein
MSKRHEIDHDTLDALDEALAADILDPAAPLGAIERFLRDEGADPEQLRREARSLVRDALEKRRLAWQERARRRIERRAAALERVSQLPEMPKEELLRRLGELRHDGRVAHAFRKRKPEESSLDELRALLEEVELLLALEKDEDSE